ncbi:glycoside hydrolase family 92 protein [Xylariaceae sp. FL0594]|nr:glycoside hydrolase family 92 protein [Xylariaceae sp. FL0594]
MAGPLLTSLPRRRRFLVVPLVVFVVWALLPIEKYNPTRRLLHGISKGFAPLSDDDVLKYVDPLIGTVNGGHVFPGASLPYGMAKPVADADHWGELAAGFVSDDSQIQGFSQLHDSGTGGDASLGNFPLFAHPGCPGDDYNQCRYGSAERALARVNGSATARPGYFAIGLNNSVYAEMTSTAHTNLFRFSFPTDREVPWVYASPATTGEQKMVPNSPLILLDLVDLSNSRSDGEIQVNETTGRMMGSGTYRPSFGRGSYTAYFCADFQGARVRRAGTFTPKKATEEVKMLGGPDANARVPYGSAGTWIQFERSPKNQILVRVGLSFISAEQACSNAVREINDFGFSRVVAAAESAWREKLSVIRADHTGLSEELKTTFWSGVYRTMLLPQDYTGENPLWESDEPYYDSFYCIWDSFRAQHPLLTIIDPEVQTDMVRALIDIYKHEGKLPDCRMSFSKGYTQGGSNADVVLADALIKNLTRGIDWKLGYEAVVSDAEDEPEDWSTSGRGGIDSWRTLGYIPYDDIDTKGSGPLSRSISRTVEYAYDDFAIALMARELGHKEDEKKYLERSNNWRNLWQPEQEDRYRDPNTKEIQGSPFRGFLQPRLRNGSFSEQSTRMCSPVYEQHVCYFDTQHSTYEGSPWLYSFYVPQDMASLIGAMGGPAHFVDRLDYFHSSGIIYMGNEPNFLPTFQFHYAGRPGRSAYWVHQYIPSLFNSSLAGIPGNDDCAMGAFSAFAFMGFFPVAGQDVYLLTPPMFREVSIRTPNGRGQGWATLRCVNFDPEFKSYYIQSATLDGKPYTRNWITHDFFRNGGVLEFVLGPEESDWGTRKEDLPPSLSTST